jgi:hypothetical protein
LINWVLPGVDEILANPLWSVTIFINDDFPTLLLPRKANSGLSGGGHLSIDGLEIK